MTPAQSQPEQHRRGSDVVAVEQLTAWKILRRYIVIGSWVGNVVFLLYGLYLGLAFGAFGGLQFFTDMFLLDLISPFSRMMGIVFGVIIGLLCIWAICVVVASACGALVYWIRFRSWPTPEK